MTLSVKGIPVTLGEFRGAVEASLNDPGFLDVLSRPREMIERGTVIHEGRNRLVALALDLPGEGKRETVLKHFRMRGIGRFKTLLVPSKAARAWRGAVILAERGIPTPRPLAVLEKRRGGTAVEGYFLAERISGVREIRGLFREWSGADLDRLLRSLAVFLRTCHRQGVLHRDLSDGNILVAEDGRGGFLFYLLDTNRIRLLKRVGWWRAASNLVRLGIPSEWRKTFLGYYCGGRPSDGLFGLWYALRKSWYTSFIRLKKRLRLKTLAAKLGAQ